MAKREQSDKDWRAQVLNMAEPATLPQAPTTTIVAQPPFSVDYHVAPSFDVVEILPPAAQERLRKLRVRSNDAHALCVPHAELQEASTAGAEAENRLKKLQAHPAERGHGLPETDACVIAQQQLVNKLTDDFRRLQARSEARAAAWRAASQAKAACEEWLKNGRPGNTTLDEAVEVEEPRLNKGEGILDGIERLRRRVRVPRRSAKDRERTVPERARQGADASADRAFGRARRGQRQPVGRA